MIVNSNIWGDDIASSQEVDFLGGRIINIYDSTIGYGTKVANFCEIGRSVIGLGCRIQAFCFIPPGTSIGNNVFLGPRTTILNDRYPSIKTNFVAEGVTIEDDVVIGGSVTIMAGVTIGRGSKIGAGALLTKDVAEGTVVMGLPGKQYINRWLV